MIKTVEYYSEVAPEKLSRFSLMRRICELLSGSYTRTGIRKWFNRPRLKLNGKCALQVIDTDPKAVYYLAIDCCFGGMGT